MECVAHYIKSSTSFSKLKTLTDNQHKKPLEAKAIRQTETLEENKHTPQCNTIPFEKNCSTWYTFGAML